MLLSFENEVHDTQLPILTGLLEYIDTELQKIQVCTDAGLDVDSIGVLETGEYLIGVGFVAVQQHLNESLMKKYLKKHDAFSLGPIHSTNASSISIINAAANWWKHESEWHRLGEVPKNGERTYKTIMDISNQHDYALSNVLASFSESKNLSFSESIIPCMEEWSKAIMEDYKSTNQKSIT